MNSVDILSSQLGTLLLSKSAASFFINGGPGTGKSYLMSVLASSMPSVVSGTAVIGPHHVTTANVAGLPALQMQACLEAGFLETMPAKERVQDIADSWLWMGQQELFSSRQVFVVLVDLDPDLSFSTIASLFSRARYLEAIWKGSGARLLYVFVGTWDTIALAKYYDRTGASFPYTKGRNYVVWEGISPDAMVSLVVGKISHALPIHGRVLYELTGGNPAVALEIMDVLRDSQLSVKRFLDATYKVALNSQIGHRWLGKWIQLSSQSQQIVRKLLRQRCIPDPGLVDSVSQMLALGIVERRKVAGKSYLEFTSWYMELLFRLHLDIIGMANTDLAEVQVQEMVPPIISVNREAYRIIHEVENDVRNFVALWLSMNNIRQTHILFGKIPEYIEEIDREEDLYERASFWRSKSESAGLPRNLNPLLAYCSMRDLASLIDEIGRVSHSDTWRHVAKLLRRLAYIRDAVMHNQLIENKQLANLIELQESVYYALARA